MTQNKTVSTTVQYVVNQSSVAAVQAANAKIVGGMQAINASAQEEAAVAGNLNAAFEKLATQQAFSKLADDAARGVISFEQLAQQAAALGATEPEINKLAADITRIQEAAANPSGGGSGIGGGNLSSQRRAFLGLGSILGAQAGGDVPRDLGQILGLSSAFGAAGVAAGVLAVGIHAVTEWQEKAAQTGKEYVASLQSITQAIGAGATKQDIQKQIDQLQNQQKAQVEYQNELQRIGHSWESLVDNVAFGSDEYTNNLKLLNADLYDLTGGAAGLKDGLGDVAIGQDVLNSLLTAGKGAINDNGAAIAQLNIAYDSSTVAINTAAEAQRKAVESNLEDADLYVQAEQMTSEERQKKIRGMLEEQATYQALIDSGRYSDAAIEAFQYRIDELSGQIEIINSVTDSYADQLKRVEDAQKAFNDAFENLGQAIEEAGKAAQKVADAEQKIRDSEADHADKLAGIAADEADKETKAREDARDKESKARDKANADAEDDARKHLEKVAEIEQQYARDAEAAVGNRDALALYKAQQKRSDDLDKEGKNYAERQKALQDHLDEQLKSIQDNLDEQLKAARDAQRKAEDAENRSYQKRQQDLIRALNEAQVEQSRAQGLALGYQKQANEAQQRELERHTAQVATAQTNANTQQANAAVTHQQTLYNITIVGGKQIESAFQNTINNLAVIASGATGGNSGGGGGGTPGAAGFGFSSSAVERIVDRRVAQMTRAALR